MMRAVFLHLVKGWVHVWEASDLGTPILKTVYEFLLTPVSNRSGIRKCLGLVRENVGFEVTTSYMFPLTGVWVLYISAVAEVFIKCFYAFKPILYIYFATF